jgi:hypothetical protein
MNLDPRSIFAVAEDRKVETTEKALTAKRILASAKIRRTLIVRPPRAKLQGFPRSG